MPALQFAPKSFLGTWRSYRIFRNGAQIGEISTPFWRKRESAIITINGVNYTAAREGAFSGAFYLDANGRRLASATLEHRFRRSFNVRTGAKSFVLKPASAFRRAFVLAENDIEVGSIAPTGLLSQKIDAKLPDDLAPEVNAFLFWLVLLMWQRATVGLMIAAMPR